MAPDIVCQIGTARRRLGILTSISGVEFDEAWEDHWSVEVDGLTVPVTDSAHRIASNRASGRRSDLADTETLELNDR